ncbi:MAG: adenylate kinase [Gammaproteobacteria bacterium]|nr:adenylate kinase [Gammaproteobacteria bacterium]
MNILFLGAPGCGKGTQSKMLIKEYGIPQISTGDLLRSEISSKSELGNQLKDIISQGKFVNDEIVLELVSKKINSPECKKGFILDGFPRNLSQAKSLDKLLNTINIQIKYVFFIDVPSELLIKRCVGRITCDTCGRIENEYFSDFKEGDKCGDGVFVKRADDNEKTVTNRLKVYTEQTEPIIDYYKEKNILHTIIGGEGPATELTNQIFDILS